MTEANKKPVSDLVKTIAADLKASLTLSDDHKFTGGDGVYVKHLPEGVTMEIADKVDHYNHNFVAAAGLAVGALSSEALKKNPELNDTKAVIHMGKKTKATVSWTKVKTGPIPGKEGETYTKYGAMAVGMSSSTDVKTGEIGHVFAEIATLTQAASSK